MDIRVSGHQIDTGESLQAHAQDRLAATVEKYFSRALSSQVTFNKAPSGAVRCDIVSHVMQGVIVKAAGVAHDAHHALDDAIAKVDKQLRRYKRRLTDRHEQVREAQREEEAAYTVFAEPDSEDVEPAYAPLVIAETRVDVPEATVSDAVMMLDLRNTNALFSKTLAPVGTIWCTGAATDRSAGLNRPDAPAMGARFSRHVEGAWEQGTALRSLRPHWRRYRGPNGR